MLNLPLNNFAGCAHVLFHEKVITLPKHPTCDHLFDILGHYALPSYSTIHGSIQVNSTTTQLQVHSLQAVIWSQGVLHKAPSSSSPSSSLDTHQAPPGLPWPPLGTAWAPLDTSWVYLVLPVDLKRVPFEFRDPSIWARSPKNSQTEK